MIKIKELKNLKSAIITSKTDTMRLLVRSQGIKKGEN